MRIFSHKPKPAYEAKSSSILRRTAGNQAALPLLQSTTQILKASPSIATAFARDFSGIPVQANASAGIQRKLKVNKPGGELEAPKPLQEKFNAGEAQALPRNDSAGAGSITGMPNPLRAEMEALSGIDLSGVRIHRNSPRPDQLNASAYTQWQDIHLGPGQDEHLPHEGWHIVQQMQGRVRPTMQTEGVTINDDAGLEREADQVASGVANRHSPGNPDSTPVLTGRSQESGVVQRKIKITGLDDTKRKKFVAKINEGSVLKFELDGTEFLQQTDKTKTSTEVYSKELVATIADAQTVILHLISKDDARFIDEFSSGKVDYDDMKSLPFNMFRIWLLHFLVERFAVPDYETKKATASSDDFHAAHQKGHEAQERQMKEWFPKKTIKYKSEGFDAASRVVDAAGNGSIDYVFDFTDVKHVFKQPIVAGVTEENIISSKIVVVK